MNTVAERLPNIRNAEKCDNFNVFVNKIAEKYDDKTAFILKKKNGKKVNYEKISYKDVLNDVKALSSIFIERGFDKKRIAIIGENRYEWVVTYLSQLYCGGVSVPLDKGLSYSELEQSIVRSKASVIVFDKKFEKIVSQLIENGFLDSNYCICMDVITSDSLYLELLMNEGRYLVAKEKDSLEKIQIDPYALSVILFTSGTTSLAKAVMLSQDNILSNIYDMELVEDVRCGDVNMAFLPYHHSFGGTGQLVMLNCGTVTTYCDGLKYIQKNLVEYKVSVFVCVPLLIESIYKRVVTTAKKNGLEKKLDFGKKLSRFLMKFGIDARRKIFKSVLDQLGGNLRLVISGAASIEPETLEGFRMFGIETINGYGMTEASPVIAAENRDVQKNGSIGKAMPSVSIRIDNPDNDGIGELIAQGPNVMMGYYDNDADTELAIGDGWLHTGDLAYIDDDGYIFICGRKKNVIVLKNGKNVFPEEIEMLVSELPYVSDSFVFALPKENDASNLSLYIKIVYNKDYFKDSAVSETEIQEKIQNDMEVLNETMPTYKRVHKVIATDKPMIKTTTGKVKRHEEIERVKIELNR